MAAGRSGGTARGLSGHGQHGYAVFPFRLEPVLEVMDAVAIEAEANAWREVLRA